MEQPFPRWGDRLGEVGVQCDLAEQTTEQANLHHDQS